MDENPTPRGILAGFAELPSYLLDGTTRLPAGLKLGNVTTGDLIALNGRWTVVLGCALVNNWVTVHVDMVGQQPLTAHESTPVHLARKKRARAPGALPPGSKRKLLTGIVPGTEVLRGAQWVKISRWTRTQYGPYLVWFAGQERPERFVEEPEFTVWALTRPASSQAPAAE